VARPIVGITTYVTVASFGAWELESALVPFDYVRAVERAGGAPLLVPPSLTGLEETIAALDGVIFSGGSDVDPALYGQVAHPETTGIVALRDRAELALLQAALARDLPLLAICRGSQLLNVALGGDLVQHLPELVRHDHHRDVPGVFSRHEVELQPGSRLAGLIGDRAEVMSHHHQGFDRLGRGLERAASDREGTIEAVELPGRRFTLGVLWHPEAGEDARLFEALVEQAAAFSLARS
jgi:putative glutamine amidotransferase